MTREHAYALVDALRSATGNLNWHAYTTGDTWSVRCYDHVAHPGYHAGPFVEITPSSVSWLKSDKALASQRIAFPVD